MRDETASEQLDLEESIHTLNKLLKAEIAAVASFRIAAEAIADNGIRLKVDDCRTSHESRVILLRKQIAFLGGSPADEPGLRGGMARMVTSGAKAFGLRAILSTLRDAETRTVQRYEESLGKVEPRSRGLIEQELLPAQRQTRDIIASLGQMLH